MAGDVGGDRLIRGTAFYPRTAPLNERQKWNAWDRYHIVDAYTDWRDEVRLIRQEAAALDQSPLAKHYILGPDSERFVDYLIPRDATEMEVGQIYFTPWCNHDGIQVGDGLVGRLAPDKFLFSADPMMRWFEANADGFDVEFEDVTHDFGLLALQGPKSTTVLEAATGETWSDLPFSRIRRTSLAGVPLIGSRQGFTGERGFELWVPSDAGVEVWDALFAVGEPLGLGVAGLHAVDVTRIEAGLVIPGADYTPAAIDPGGDDIPTSAENQATPFELNMHRFIDFGKKHDFVGRRPLEHEAEHGSKRTMIGIEVDWQAIVAASIAADLPPEVTPQVIRFPLRVLHDGTVIGRTTSVTWSPTVKKLIGFAHVQTSAARADTAVVVDWDAGPIRTEVAATLVDLPHFKWRRATDG